MPGSFLWTFRCVWFGNDAFHRKTIVLGFPWTGTIIIALWHFKTPCECSEFEEYGKLVFCPNCTAMQSRWDQSEAVCWTCSPPTDSEVYKDLVAEGLVWDGK